MNHRDGKPVTPNQWYVAVDNRTVGPVTTELIIRGLENGKVPPDAMVCAVGSQSWAWVSAVEPFVATVRRSFPPPPPTPPAVKYPPHRPEDYEEETLVRRDRERGAVRARDRDEEAPGEPTKDRVPSLYGLDVAFAKAAAAAPRPPARAPIPSRPPPLQSPPPRVPPPPPSPKASPLRPSAPPIPPPPPPAPVSAASAHRATETDDEDGVDIPIDVFDDLSSGGSKTPVLDWTQPFVEQLEVARGVRLPSDALLLDSLRATSRRKLAEEDAMWNLCLCVAMGSDQVARAAAEAFFDAVRDGDAAERLAWITRVLLSKGFMPSGIPQEAGLRGLRVLRETCPAELRVELERAVLG
jgi:hypothetical protein